MSRFRGGMVTAGSSAFREPTPPRPFSHKPLNTLALWGPPTFSYLGNVDGPSVARVPELEQDYLNMREMIFGEPPTFERLLDVLREIERHING